MSRETEKLLKELQRFLDSNTGEATDETTMNAMAEQFLAEYDQKCADQKDFVPETADDYLSLAEQAPSKKKHMEYLRKALELEPDNLDARLQMITCTTERHLDEQRFALQELLELAEQQMEEAGAFKEYSGQFWTAIETRPYMRVRYTYFDVLISCGMMRQAISEGQRLLELCESDNLGIRYQMMHLYVFMEDEMHALNKFDKAEGYIRRLAKVNKDTKKFLRAAAYDKLDDYIDELNPFGYQPFTMEELLNELIQFSYLLDSVPDFFAWASKVLAVKSGTSKDIKVADKVTENE